MHSLSLVIMLSGAEGYERLKIFEAPWTNVSLATGAPLFERDGPLLGREGTEGREGREGRYVGKDGRDVEKEGRYVGRDGPDVGLRTMGDAPVLPEGLSFDCDVPPLSPPNGLSPLESLSSRHAERESARAGTARQTANFLRSIRDPLSSARLVRGSGQLKDLAFGTERPTRELSGVEGLGPWGRLPFFRLWARWVSLPGRPGVFGDFTGRALAHRLAVHIGLSRPFDPHMDTRGWRSDSLWAIVGP